MLIPGLNGAHVLCVIVPVGRSESHYAVLTGGCCRGKHTGVEQTEPNLTDRLKPGWKSSSDGRRDDVQVRVRRYLQSKGSVESCDYTISFQRTGGVQAAHVGCLFARLSYICVYLSERFRPHRMLDQG